MSTTSPPLSARHTIDNSLTYRKNSASPFKTVRFSPYKLPQKSASSLYLTGHSHAHPNPATPAYNLPVTSTPVHIAHEGEVFENTRHVRLDFELFEDGQQCTPSREQFQTILSLFPTSFKLSFSPPFMIVACIKPPPKPWPVTVAGMPLYLTTDGETSPMDYGLTGRGPRRLIEAGIERWRTPSLETFQQLFGLFDSLGAKIHRLQWIGWCFLALGASEPYADWRARLPFVVNGIRMGYVFGEQTVHEKALRRKLPADRIPDDEAYIDLRPGVMIASKTSGHENSDVMTTSGVCLQSPSGKKYITVAKHGFPGGVGDQVWHPNPSGRCIAKVSKVFGETDIALAELGNVHYSKETFSAPDALASAFGSLLDVKQLRVGDPIFMDTPYNGRCEGSLMKVGVLRILSDEPADDTEYVIGAFAYFGNGADTLFDGCCGGVVWNSSHNVVGQFCFQQDGVDKLCYCPTFDALRRLDYIIADA